jgi:Lipid desaturase domain
MSRFFSFIFSYRLVEVIAVVAFGAYFFLQLERLGGVFTNFNWFTRAGFLLFVPLASYIAADFISGFVHYLGDTFGDEQTPFFGKNYILPFRIHHVDPKDITRHNFFEINGNNSLVSLFVMIPLYHFLPVVHVWQFVITEFFVFFVLFIFLTNQIHKWAHEEPENVSSFVRWLQRKRLILSPSHHSVHHTAPFATYFCITSGWLNPLLARLHFFEKITETVKKQ